MPTTTKYIWDDENLLAEADATDTINVVYTNEPQQYGNLVSTRISGATSYHHFDALGSTRQLTNSVAHPTDVAIYEAWGNIAAATGLTGYALRWLGERGYYTDSEIDSLAVRRRRYAPTLARWISQDPVQFLDGPNLFAYVSNRPIFACDPSGAITINCRGDNFDCPECGTTLELDWSVLLSQKAPCRGYLVQKVDVWCFQSACVECPKQDAFNLLLFIALVSQAGPSGSFYEAWDIDKGQFVANAQNSKRKPPPKKLLKYTDSSSSDVPSGTCGFKIAIGTFKFFCRDKADAIKYGSTETGDLGEIGNPKAGGDWKTKEDHKLGPCTAKGSDVLAKDGDAPFWTATAVNKEGPEKRFSAVFWCCCPGQAEFVAASGLPRIFENGRVNC